MQLPQHFFGGADTKKHRYTSGKASAFADCRDEFRMLLVMCSFPYHKVIINVSHVKHRHVVNK